MATQFAQIVSEDKPTNQSAVSLSIVDETGKATPIGGAAPDLTDYAKKADLSAYAKTDALPKAATASAAGTVKQAALVAAPAADADAAALSTSVSAIIKALQDAGIMAAK